MQFIDLGAQRERIRDRLKAAIDNVVEEGRYILGPQVTEFENKLAAYVGTKHVVACANGTDALLLPLFAAGIGPGETAKMVWDSSTDSEPCEQWIRAKFSDGEYSAPSKQDFCEDLDTPIDFGED